MLFNEPKLLKSFTGATQTPSAKRFSALQRAEIAEIGRRRLHPRTRRRFSALQRAEIAEMLSRVAIKRDRQNVSVLFNEPKLLK